MSTEQKHYTDDQLCYFSASELLTLFRAREVTPNEILEAQIRRIESKNKIPGNETESINAITFKDYERARGDAEESTKHYRSGQGIRPLEGITVAVKDEHEVKGWPHTEGSLARARFKSEPSTEDSAIVEKLRQAGAVIHIQTTAPEGYIAAVTWSRLWGVTRNPWNPYYTCGGSSGGSGASLAAGFTTLATGNDMGGSIRIPSAFNALCGFKPPFGRVASGQLTYRSCGPLARTMEDLARLQDAITGPSPKDLAALRPKLDYSELYNAPYKTQPDPKERPKLAVYYPDKSLTHVDDSVEVAMKAAVESYQELGYQVDSVEIKLFTRDNFQIFFEGMISSGAMATLVAEDLAPFRELICRNTRMFLDGVPVGGPLQTAKADQVSEALHRELQEGIFGNGYSALLVPTLATPFVPADLQQDENKDYVLITKNKEREQDYTFNWVLTWPFNLVSRYPVVNVPIGQENRTKVPIGMQIIGNTFDDLAAFRVATQFFNHKASPKFFKNDGMPEFRYSPLSE